MSGCSDVPTQTLFGTSTSTFLTTETTTSLETSTLPRTTTTFLVTTSSCRPGRTTVAIGGTTAVPTCTPVVITSTSVIDGGVTTIVDTNQVVHTTNSLVTFPTQTLFSRTCPTSTNTTPTSTSPTDPSSSSQSSTSHDQSTPSSFSTYSLYTPPPTTFFANTSITSGGSVYTSQVLVSSQPPLSTVYSSPNWKSNSKESASGSIIGGVVAAVLGSLVVAGLALYFWRRRKHRRDKEEQEYMNQVRKDFGRRLELEFEDDEAGNGQDRRTLSAVDIFYSDDAPQHGSTERPMSLAESAPMLVAGAPNQRPQSSSSTSPNNVNNRISIVSSSHSLYPHHPFPTNDGPSYDVPPVPTYSETQRNTLYDHSRRSTHSSASSNALAPRPQSTRTSSTDLLINLQSPAQSFAEHSSTPSTSALSSTAFNPQPKPASVVHTPATENNSQQLPPSSDRHSDKDAYAGLRHQHNRSSSRSSIMSALLTVAPLQQLKIANRTKLDELDDDDEHEMSSKLHHSL